jgi:hypothetical protein
MKYLKELSRIVTRNKLGKIEILDTNGTSSMYGQFYDALTKHDLGTDKEVAKQLYRTTPSDDRYRQLKSRFRRRLMANLFLLDMNDSSFSDYKKADYNAYRNYAVCRILMRNGGVLNFEKIARGTFNLVRRYEMTQVAVLFAQELCDYYSFAGNTKLFDYYLAELHRLRPQLAAELEAETIHQQIKLYYQRVKGSPEEMRRLMEPQIERLWKLRVDYRTYGMQLTSFLCLTAYYQLLGEHAKVLDIARESEEYFAKHQVIKVAEYAGIAALVQMECYLNMRDFESGSRMVRRALKLIKEHSQNWVFFHEQYMHLAFLTGRYEIAADIFSSITRHPMFKGLSPLRQERWRLFEGYLHFVLKAQGRAVPATLRAFDPKRFSRSLPSFSKDKAGFNTAIIILQIIWLSELGRFDEIIDRADGLRMYNYRYLRKSQGQRAFIFIKMLLASQAAAFRFPAVQKATAKLLTQLRNTEDSTVSEWEIIPYEILWERFLANLRQAG